MTTTIKISATALKTLTLFLVVNLTFACSNPKTPSNDPTAQPVAATTQPSAETATTIMGIVVNMTMVKTATRQTLKRMQKTAVVSLWCLFQILLLLINTDTLNRLLTHSKHYSILLLNNNN
jgi:hypothetical protein